MDQLRVGSWGAAFAHFSIPFGSRRSAVAELCKTAATVQIEATDLLWVLGDTDVLAQLRLRDFRQIRSFHSRLLSTTLPAATWIYAVPYVDDHRAEGLAHTKEDPPDTQGVKFVIYLRVNRSLYRHFGVKAEVALVRSLQEFFRSLDGVTASVNLSLGAPDLVLHGEFRCESSEFLACLASLRALTWPENPGLEVFVATVTLLGFSWNVREPAAPILDGQSIIDASPIVLAKLGPVFFERLISSGASDFALADDIEPHRIYLIDGRLDAAFIYRGGTLTPEKLYGSIERLKSRGCTATETHLLLAAASEATSRVAEVVRDLQGRLSDEALCEEVRNRCRCRELAGQFSVSQDRLKVLSDGLAREVEGVLALFKAVLADRGNCCDSVAALQAALLGLEILLSQLDDAQQKIDGEASTNTEAIQESFSFREQLWEAVGVWCVGSERALKERTADSVGVLFGSRDSVPDFRGSLRKLLFLADGLMRSFYAKISDQVKSRLPDFTEPFVTSFDPVGSIRSDLYTGNIWIPSRYLFVLHLAVPQLWHEVGQFIFQNKYLSPFSEATKAALSIFGSTETADGTGAWADQYTVKFLTDAADMYADLLVLYYGFACDSDRFSQYLITMYLDTILHMKVPRRLQPQYLEVLVRRLFVATCFREELKALSGVSDGDFEKHASAFERNWPEREFLSNCITLVSNYMEKNRYKNRSALLRMSREAWEELGDMARGKLASGPIASFWIYARVLVHRLRNEMTPKKALGFESLWSKLKLGMLVELDPEDVGDLYLQLYDSDLDRLVNSDTPLEPNFVTMAALGQSCNLALLKASAPANAT